MKHCFGIIGKSLTHSFSPAYFNEKFKLHAVHAEYKVFLLDNIAELRQLIANMPQLKGLNVTIPYKQAVIPYLDSIDAHAKRIGAVNCIKIDDGILYGYNTDYGGFAKTLINLHKYLTHPVLILGDGGAAQAIKYVLTKFKVPYAVVSRSYKNGNLTYQQLRREHIEQCRLIINTTPLGMYPDVATYPQIPYEGITANHCAYDLIYNPPETAFLKKATIFGAETLNGKDLLINQAELSWNIWSGLHEMATTSVR